MNVKEEEPKIDDKIGQNRKNSQKSRTSAGNPFEGLSNIFHLIPPLSPHQKTINLTKLHPLLLHELTMKSNSLIDP